MPWIPVETNDALSEMMDAAQRQVEGEMSDELPDGVRILYEDDTTRIANHIHAKIISIEDLSDSNTVIINESDFEAAWKAYNE